MAENGAETPEAGAQPQQPPVAPKMNVATQFIRDVSFENILAQKGISGGELTPEVEVKVQVEPKKRSAENQYEVSLKINVNSTNKNGGETLFILELDYVGVFVVENVPQEQLHPFLMIECPRMIFPFVRRIAHDLTRDGGFPAMNLENIDFVALYRNEIVKRAAEIKAQQDQKADA